MPLIPCRDDELVAPLGVPDGYSFRRWGSCHALESTPLGYPAKSGDARIEDWDPNGSRFPWPSSVWSRAVGLQDSAPPWAPDSQPLRGLRTASPSMGWTPPGPRPPATIENVPQ